MLEIGRTYCVLKTTLVYCDDGDNDVCSGGCNDVDSEDVVGRVCHNDFDHPHVTR